MVTFRIFQWRILCLDSLHRNFAINTLNYYLFLIKMQRLISIAVFPLTMETHRAAARQSVFDATILTVVEFGSMHIPRSLLWGKRMNDGVYILKNRRFSAA